MLVINILDHAAGPIIRLGNCFKWYQRLIYGRFSAVVLPWRTRVNRLPKGIVTVDIHMAGRLEFSNDCILYIITASTRGRTYWTLFSIDRRLVLLSSAAMATALTEGEEGFCSPEYRIKSGNSRLHQKPSD